MDIKHLEVPTGAKKPIDIVASKDGLTIDLELATLDMYADLKYLGFATIPDKARSIMLNKILTQISHYAIERSNPIILVLNLTHAPDADLHGIIYALCESEVEHIAVRPDSTTNRFTTFERDPEFLKLDDGRKLTAVLHYKEEVDDSIMRVVGDIIPNASANIKL